MQKIFFLFSASMLLFLQNTSAQTVLVNGATAGGFESGVTFAANGWTAVNDVNNQWFVGTVAVNAGVRSAHVGTAAGNNNYNANQFMISHFYRSVTLTAAEPYLTVSFNWKGVGEGCCDYIQVFVVPSATVPTAGVGVGSGQLGGNLNSQAAWQAFNQSACYAPGTYNLIISWRNDGSIGTNPAGAIDNIHVVRNPAPTCASQLGTGVTNVGALPYNSGAGTTCGSVNDITAANAVACGSTSYFGGEDHVWSFTPATSGCININLTSAGSWNGLMLYQGCPVGCSPGSCIGFSQSSAGNQSISGISVTAGVTYYVVLDVFPAPSCNPYTNLSISAPSAGPANDAPCSATPLTIGTPLATNNTCAGNVSEPATPGCWTGGTINSTWYSFVAPLSTYATLQITNGTIGSVQFAVFSGTCGPGLTQIYCGAGNGQACLSGLTPGATYYVMVDGQNNDQGTFTIVAGDPSSFNCLTSMGTGVVSVGSLPYSSGAGTTCGSVNDLTSANTVTCGSTSYLGGEDRVYVFTPSTSGQITINLTSGGSWNGLMLYDGCPLSNICTGGSGSCVAFSQSSAGNQTITACVTAGITYYLVMDVFPAPSCNAFTNLTISAPVPPGSCVAALGAGVINVASLPYASGAGTTCGSADNVTASNTNTCGSTCYYGGEDQVFVFTPTSSGSININLTSGGSWNGLMLYDGCPLTTVCSGTPGSCIAYAQSSAGNQSLSACVTAGTTYYLVLDVCPAPSCNPYTNLTISAPVAGCSYSPSSIAYAPSSYVAGTLLTFPDDQHSAVLPIGFTFCFYGTNYTQAVVSSNAYISFNTANAGTYSSWVTVPIPTTTPPEVVNSVMFPWHDVDPSVGASSDIRYLTSGVAPNRRFIVNFSTVPMFSAACNSMLYTGQAVLHETTNLIETFIQAKPVCASWNSGNAVHGLNGPGGCDFSVVPGRNNTVWTATNDAWRFTPGTCCNTPLAVELTNFAGENISASVNRLYWETATEIDFDYFVLERSSNGFEYEDVIALNSKGTINQISSYSYFDNQIFPKTYYRLRMVDKNGTFNHSNAVLLFNEQDFAMVEGVYPNPFDEIVYLDISSSKDQSAFIQVKDVFGKEVFRQQIMLNEGQQAVPFDLGALSKGIYFIELTSGDHYHSVFRLVKQ